jgi:hypothetical protein
MDKNEFDKYNKLIKITIKSDKNMIYKVKILKKIKEKLIEYENQMSDNDNFINIQKDIKELINNIEIELKKLEKIRYTWFYEDLKGQGNTKNKWDKIKNDEIQKKEYLSHLKNIQSKELEEELKENLEKKELEEKLEEEEEEYIDGGEINKKNIFKPGSKRKRKNIDRIFYDDDDNERKPLIKGRKKYQKIKIDMIGLCYNCKSNKANLIINKSERNIYNICSQKCSDELWKVFENKLKIK